MKVKLKIFVKNAALYFLKWELPYFEKEFELVDEPGTDVVSFAFGPDVLAESANVPALKRVAVLFPGFDFNPYHNLGQREETLATIKDSYDLVFVNPGPVHDALVSSGKLVSHPFSVDVDKILKFKRIRRSLDSLVHVSADSPQKDWERSLKIMELTGLPHEVYPPRVKPDKKITLMDRIKWRYNKYIVQTVAPTKAFRTNLGYVDHLSTIKKYVEYDGFVHIAEEKPLPHHLDGKYTAALFEAGITGAIVFWHDTFGTGNDFESVFALSKEPETAAGQILEIRKGIDVERHSRLTSEEIADRCHPQKIVAFRRRLIEGLL